MKKGELAQKDLMTQVELSLGLQALPELRLVPEHLLKGCKTIRQAYGVCISQSIRPLLQSQIAHACGKSENQFSTALKEPHKQGREYPYAFDAEWVRIIQIMAGNMAIYQWQAMTEGYRLAKESDEDRQERELEKQLLELRARKAG